MKNHQENIDRVKWRRNPVVVRTNHIKKFLQAKDQQGPF